MPRTALIRACRRLAVGAAALALAWGQEGLECSSCHDQTQTIQNTPHAALGCASCHPKHETYPHPAGIPRPECSQCHERIARLDALGVHGQARAAGGAGPDCAMCHGDVHQVQRPASTAFRRSVPETCGMCHSDVAEQFQASVHGKALARGDRNAPLCTDCHGEHSILAPSRRASPVHPAQIRETCGRCHGDVRLTSRHGLPADRVVSFDQSFHGLAAKAGSLAVANCASCHGYHDVLPSSDPQSKTNPQNLPQTCGQCHPGAGRRYAIGPVHFLETGDPPAGVRWARSIYLVVIPLTIGLMVLHNLADWFRKLYQLRLRHRAGTVIPANPPIAALPEVRMYRFERIQHFLLLFSFSVLAWTGFALKYPDQWWARPLLVWEPVYPLRATVHRFAGAILIGVSVSHVISLIVNKRLRNHWRELIPRAADAREAFQNLIYLLGVRSRKPSLSSHGYVEKAEYWAVIWGTAIMAITGVMLWAVNFTLQWLPKTWLDFATTVHFYEAVLATLAIVVWHFYFVIFDPEVYPMDTAWLSGIGVRKREPHQPRQQTPASDTNEES